MELLTKHIMLFNLCSAHWYLAIICFPSLLKPDTVDLEVDIKVLSSTKKGCSKSLKPLNTPTNKDIHDKRETPETSKRGRGRPRHVATPKTSTPTPVTPAPITPRFVATKQANVKPYSPRKTRSSVVTPQSTAVRGRKSLPKSINKNKTNSKIIDETPKKKYMSKEEEIVEKMRARKNQRVSSEY